MSRLGGNKTNPTKPVEVRPAEDWHWWDVTSGSAAGRCNQSILVPGHSRLFFPPVIC